MPVNTGVGPAFVAAGPPPYQVPIKYLAHARPSLGAEAQKGRYRISLGAAPESAGTVAPALNPSDSDSRGEAHSSWVCLTRNCWLR